MNVSESRSPASDAHPLNLRELAPHLRAMLADEDWLPACQDLDKLDELLYRIDTEPSCGNEVPDPDVALLIAAHQDFCRFRRAMAARLNTPDDTPLHITPDEWLQLRLRHGRAPESLEPYANYRAEEDRFHVVD
ncbi:hypothetical protein [Oleiagrimonas soli]|uniref:Uncharacterized protein n=1 Tax=Oleiagrimonas soli TaxID=1543381 RepID=A0A099CVI6_9GAMM|nr:hypothetical protein [Oleiagrimonas soli]KGI77799.1 hypothetical protein LF63_0105085 [Oleiagrimonas soli]MBB6183869.1 hypothetical protein [Oleiagrimonas soli]